MTHYGLDFTGRFVCFAFLSDFRIQRERVYGGPGLGGQGWPRRRRDLRRTKCVHGQFETFYNPNAIIGDQGVGLKGEPGKSPAGPSGGGDGFNEIWFNDRAPRMTLSCQIRIFEHVALKTHMIAPASRTACIPVNTTYEIHTGLEINRKSKEVAKHGMGWGGQREKGKYPAAERSRGIRQCNGAHQMPRDYIPMSGNASSKTAHIHGRKIQR